MEVYSSSVEDQLIDGLSFKLAPVHLTFKIEKVLHSFLVGPTSILPTAEQKL